MLRAITINNLSKVYRLGTISTWTALEDVKRLWTGLFNKTDPEIIYAKNKLQNEQSEEKYIKALNNINLEGIIAGKSFYLGKIDIKEGQKILDKNA